MSKQGSLQYQILHRLDSLEAYGTSRRQARLDAAQAQGISYRVAKMSVFLGHYDVAFTYRKYHHVVPHTSVQEDSLDIEAAMFGVARDQVVTNAAPAGLIARDSERERPATSTVAAL